MTKKQLLALAAALSAASLSACSGSEPDAAPSANEEGAAVPSRTEDLTPAPVATESPTSVVEVPITNTAVADAPAAEAPAPDEQMMDDAAATGMTARTTRDDSAEVEAVPAEQVERK